MTKTKLPPLTASLLMSFLLPFASLHSAVIVGNPSDNEYNSSNTLGTATAATIRVGSSGGIGKDALLVFQLPDFGAVANPFTSADLSLQLSANTGSFTFNGDLYGLGIQSSSTLTIGSGVLTTNRFYQGATVDPNATLIQDSVLTPSSPTGSYINTDATGDANLLSFLNSSYAGGAGANQYVIFRINPDTTTPGSTFGYNVRSGNNGLPPQITYTAIPEPQAGLLVAVGAMVLFVFRANRRVRA